MPTKRISLTECLDLDRDVDGDQRTGSATAYEMGCGSSAQVVSGHDAASDGVTTDAKLIGNGHHDDDLPTVVLPDTPARPKPPIAYEIPLEEFDGNRGAAVTPPPHVQRLLQPPTAEITLPHIEEKLAEAEQRRQLILQQRATSAQKRAQKIISAFNETGNINSNMTEILKHGANALTIPPEPRQGADKNI
ncbi:unnamed protein product, partial [Iphiclides podalirius]